MKRENIDFHAVLPQHMAIHDRLLNWARYVGSGRGGSACTPMFRLYRCPDTWIEPEPRIPVDSLDGHRIEQAVAALPEKHMGAIRWSYVYSAWGMSLFKACRVLAVRQDGLHELIANGRSMLKNRAADLNAEQRAHSTLLRQAITKTFQK